MGKKYIGAIDQGTSSSRFILFDADGNIAHKHQVEFKSYTPHPGWVEHDPLEIMHSVTTCMEEVMKGVPASEVAAIGITNQRETTVVWDRVTGKPLHRAIVWLDTRTRGLVDELIEKHGSVDAFRPVCGLPLSTYFSGIKLRWLIDNVPAVREACDNGRAMFGTIESWLLWNLSGGVEGGHHITDVTNASRTMMMDITTLQWDPHMLNVLGVPRAVLPTIRSNSEVYGHVSSGPLRGCAIAGMIGDQQGALLGQMCLEAGSLKNTYGTGCFMLLNTGTKPVQSENGLLTTVAMQLGEGVEAMYALEGSIAVAGRGVSWAKDNLGLFDKAADISPLAASVEDNAGVYLVPAFSGLLSPYWRSDARGVIAGLTLYSTKAHVARAVLEATAYQAKDVARAMEQDAGVELKELRVDGGLCASDFLMQFQADQLQVPVKRPKVLEATAFGAALAAGLAVGFWSSPKEAQSRMASTFHTFVPTASPSQKQQHDTFYRGWKRAVSKTFDLAGPPPPLPSSL